MLRCSHTKHTKTMIDTTQGNPFEESDAIPQAASSGPSAALKAFWAAESAVQQRIGEWAKDQAAAGRAVHWDRNNADGTDISPELAGEMSALTERCVAILTPSATAAGKEAVIMDDVQRHIDRCIRDAAKWVWEDRVMVNTPQRKSPRWF